MGGGGGLFGFKNPFFMHDHFFYKILYCNYGLVKHSLWSGLSVARSTTTAYWRGGGGSPFVVCTTPNYHLFFTLPLSKMMSYFANNNYNIVNSECSSTRALVEVCPKTNRITKGDQYGDILCFISATQHQKSDQQVQDKINHQLQ